MLICSAFPLRQVFKRHGLERSDPLGAAFDPNHHNAVFEVEDPSKPAGTVAHVMKVSSRQTLPLDWQDARPAPHVLPALKHRSEILRG